MKLHFAKKGVYIMTVDLKGRSLLTLKDYSKEEIEYLIDLSMDLKKKKAKGIKGELLRGKNIVLLFEKTSTRTRCAFEVAAFDEGANVTNLTNSQMGKKESIEDTARVLGRYYHGIEFRGYRQETVEALHKYSGVPVWNGLTDLYHPTQVLADFMTIKEHVKKELKEIKFVYIGDGRNNVANSLMIGAAKVGMEFVAIAPKELFPSHQFVTEIEELANSSGGSITITDSIEEGIKKADVIYTDVWISMGEEDKTDERIKLLLPYQVNKNVVKKTENKNVIFLHCLPSFHDLNTVFSKEIYDKFALTELEVTDEVFRSTYSKVFDQAENRMHTIKAVMVATL